MPVIVFEYADDKIAIKSATIMDKGQEPLALDDEELQMLLFAIDKRARQTMSVPPNEFAPARPDNVVALGGAAVVATATVLKHQEKMLRLQQQLQIKKDRIELGTKGRMITPDQLDAEEILNLLGRASLPSEEHAVSDMKTAVAMHNQWIQAVYYALTEEVAADKTSAYLVQELNKRGVTITTYCKDQTYVAQIGCASQPILVEHRVSYKLWTV